MREKEEYQVESSILFARLLGVGGLLVGLLAARGDDGECDLSEHLGVPFIVWVSL
jgi:hypothetical protein